MALNVIYGVLVVDSCDLVLPPGMRLYMHGGIAKAENAEGERYYPRCDVDESVGASTANGGVVL